MVTRRRSLDGLVDEVPDVPSNPPLAVPEPVLVFPRSSHSQTVRVLNNSVQ